MSEPQHVEHYFCTAPVEECLVMLDKIRLVMRARGVEPATKLGRRRKPKSGPGQIDIGVEKL